jgi:glycosyltransferase involved in cell wall biosynthesis
MNASKPRLAIVSSHNICCPLAYYADAIKDFLTSCFEVEIVDLKTSELLRQEGKSYEGFSEAHIDQICEKLQSFDLVNVHLELGIFGTKTEHILSRIIKICQASKRLILTVHTIDYKNSHTGHANVYQEIMHSLKQRPSSNPFHLIAHLPQEKVLLQKHFGFENVTDFPLIFLTNERRKLFQQTHNPSVWKRQFGLREEDKTIGVFGLLSSYKNYLHALRTLNLLPTNYKLLIIGEAHHMNIKEWQVDPVVQEMTSYLDAHPSLADRVIFTGRRDDAKYYEDLANIDFVLLPAFEAGQSGSATLCNALELSCAIVKSNNLNSRQYEIYFPNCFEVFDIGNHYEAKHKILNFDKTKIANLRKRADLYSEVQLQQIYQTIYGSMKDCTPVAYSTIVTSYKPLGIKSPRDLIKKVLNRSGPMRTLFNLMPRPIQSLLSRVKRKLNSSL